jgi:hypothetical protein
MKEDPATTADTLIATINSLKERAESAVRTAEEANSKANSESGFAFNAKQNAEDHAKAIAQVRGTVDADFAWLTTTKKNAEELAQAITSSKTTSDGDARAAAQSKAEAEREAASVKAANERVTALLPAIEKIQGNIAATLEKVTAESATVSMAKATAEAGATAIQALQTQIAETASKATVDGATVAKNESDSKSLQASMAEIVATAKVTHERVSEYQNQLSQLTAEFNELHTKIEGLLPNATSAGLASAFRNQKGRFLKPQRNWLITFVVAIFCILLAGVVGLPGIWPWAVASEGQNSWDSILLHLVTRLPIVAPLVWLATYAGHHYTLALRVEEEYAFKEAMSTAFEGYKREMVGISSGSDGVLSPIGALCENVLRALAQRPGRIYEGRHENITPFTPFVKAVGDAAAGVVSVAKK